MSVRATLELNTAIDNNQHDLSSEITLAFPLSLPYSEIHADQNFEKMIGDFEYNGEHYKFIKQKFQGDTLYIVCIKNEAKKKIDSAIENYATASNDHPSQSKQTLNLLSKLFKDFHPGETLSFKHVDRLEIPMASNEISCLLLDPFSQIFSPPPEQVS